MTLIFFAPQFFPVFWSTRPPTERRQVSQLRVSKKIWDVPKQQRMRQTLDPLPPPPPPYDLICYAQSWARNNTVATKRDHVFRPQSLAIAILLYLGVATPGIYTPRRSRPKYLSNFFWSLRLYYVVVVAKLDKLSRAQLWLC